MHVVYGYKRAFPGCKSVLISGSWSAAANTADQWLRVTFASSVMLRSVITQGRQDWDQWVTSYTLQYSPDNVNHFYVRDVANNVGLFPGNTALLL